MIEKSKSGIFYRIEFINDSWGIYKKGVELVRVIPWESEFGKEELLQAAEYIHNLP